MVGGPILGGALADIGFWRGVFFINLPLAVVTFFLPLNLIQVQGYSSSIAGFTLLPFSILLATLSPLTGNLADRYGSRVMLTVGPLIVGGRFAALALPGMTAGPSAYWTTERPTQLMALFASVELWSALLFAPHDPQLLA